MRVSWPPNETERAEARTLDPPAVVLERDDAREPETVERPTDVPVEDLLSAFRLATAPKAHTEQAHSRDQERSLS